jgi:hypothetical protein
MDRSKDFRFGMLIIEQKQNILIWSKNVLIASKSFPFWPKNSGTKQSNLILSGNCLGQNRTFLIIQKLIDRNKTF